MQALLCAIVLLAALLTVAIKTLAPVVAADSVIAGDSVVIAVEPNNSTQAEARPNRPAPRFNTFEFESSWDKGSFWDAEAPAFDLSPAPGR
jgi:hypothetical protein